MKRKFLAAMLAGVLAMIAFATPAFAAVASGEKRVTLGADLTAAEKTQIYDYFGIQAGSVKEITVTNAEERQYLSGLVPDEKIGNVALSSIFLTTLGSGQGLNITTNNINFCTDQMYINALKTAGITDASVMITAPHPVSGTAALTGIYKAYEDITGVTLNENAKQAGTQELVISGNIAQSIGDADTQKIIGQLQGILAQTKTMSDAELRTQILDIAKSNNVTLTDDQVNQLISLCRTLSSVDLTKVGGQISQISSAMNTASQIGQGFSDFFKGVTGFLGNVGSFFTNLFGGASSSASAS